MPAMSQVCGRSREAHLAAPEVTVCGMCGVLYDSVVPHFAKA